MNIHSDFYKISHITDNIYLSGIFPLENDGSNINSQIIKLNIKYIISCVDRNNVGNIHDNLLIKNPNISILYLPYNDNLDQNLWAPNEGQVQIVKYAPSSQTYDELKGLLEKYRNKPLIEIGYHFIDRASRNNENVLIHCMAGVSRSTSLVAYYLMKKFCMDFYQSLRIIRKGRKIINPNYSFNLQLRAYGKKKDRFLKEDADIFVIIALQKKHLRKIGQK